MRTPSLLTCFVMLAAPLAYSGAQPPTDTLPLNTFEFTSVPGRHPGPSARIKRIWTGTTPFGRTGQTGSLYIRYSSGLRIVAWRAPRENLAKLSMRDPSRNIPAGAVQLRIAKNGRTAGWADLAETCCESYPLTISVGIYRSGNRVLHITGPGMLVYWNFLGNGRYIVAGWGPAHGPGGVEYQRIDLKTDRVVGDVWDDSKTDRLPAGAPKWALNAEAAFTATF